MSGKPLWVDVLEQGMCNEAGELASPRGLPGLVNVSSAGSSGATCERCRLLVRARILFRDLGLDQKGPMAGSDGGTSTGEKEFR